VYGVHVLETVIILLLFLTNCI